LKNHIDMTVTNEGLRIELSESATGTFFDSGSPKNQRGWLRVAHCAGPGLGKLPNKLALEGHTDSKQYTDGGTYGNWELSTDRANAARRLMMQHGVGEIRSRKCAASRIKGCARKTILWILPIAAFPHLCNTSRRRKPHGASRCRGRSNETSGWDAKTPCNSGRD